MRVTFMLPVLASAVLTASPAQAGAPGLPAAVAADLKELAAECTGVGGRAVTRDAVKRVDLNGDGKEDYILDVGSIVCDGAASIYGDRAKRVTAYVGHGAGGARDAFRDMAYGIRLEGTGSAARLWLTVSGERCGRKPAASFASESFCERFILWNGKAGKFDYAPVSTVRMID